jgi:ketosteroid isomerase-like protein
MTTRENPSMESWQAAWADANAEALGGSYADAGVVVPPNHAAIVGPAAILNFFRGGFDAVEVRFFPETVTGADSLAFEMGTVRDIERGTGKVIEVCDYAIVWVADGAGWKIRYHTWTIPREEGAP